MFRIISTSGPTRGLIYRTFNLDGIPTIGVVAGEEYAVQWKRHTVHPAKVILSIDGLNPRTGQQAVEDPADAGYPFQATVDHWDETHQGGGAFKFTDNANFAVATYRPGADLAPGYIGTAFFEEPPYGLRPRQQHPTGFASGSPFPLQHQTIGYRPDEILKSGGGGGPAYPSSGGATRSAGGGAPATMGFEPGGDGDFGMSTGIGEYVQGQLLPNPILHAGLPVGFHQIRYLPLQLLRDRTPYHPRGFQARPVADLGDVPRMSLDLPDEDRFVIPGMDRFQVA